jgi:Concanavalin A-like lectin/glucanases superfamily/Secretion system C-terminal sorting domain
MKKTILALMMHICIALPFATTAQVSTDSLLLEMTFDGNANDISGNNNNGIIHNVVPDTNRFGVPGKAYRFNGVDSYIEIPASPSLNRIQSANVISISAWVNIFQWWNNQNVFSIFERYNPATDAGWLFEANWVGGGLLFLADETTGSNWVGANYTWNFHEWHYLALTYDHAQSIAKFYVDSVQVGNVTYSASIFTADTTSPFVIGRSLAGPDEYSDGLIDDYKIYNRVLTPAEISTIYTTGLQENLWDAGFSIYPNPARDNITVQYNLQNKEGVLLIFNTLGKLVSSNDLPAINNGITVDISTFTKGMYAARIISEGRSITRKIIVE